MSGSSPLYDDPALAAAYARVTAANVANAAYERPAIRALLGAVHGTDLLDAGCAAGEHAAWLVERGARVTALDASATMVRLAGVRLGASARVLQADLAQPLPFADGSFDRVFSSLTLHYLAEWLPTLREFARVLRRGGRLVFSTHHPFMTADRVQDYHAVALVEDAWSGFGAEPVAVSYYHRSLQRILDELAAAGFTLRAVREPRPTAAAAGRDPVLAAHLRTRPGFLLVDAEPAPR